MSIDRRHRPCRDNGGAAPRGALVCAGLAIATSLSWGVAGAQGDVSSPIPADPRLYVGQLVFLDHCASCHGVTAEGSRFAPDLLARIRRLTQRDFETILDDGYPGIVNGPAPWGQTDAVDRYARELWAYLAARASGDIGPGELTPRAGN